MFEFMIRMKWLLLDLELHLILWKLNDIDYRFTLDREVREWAEANQRDMAILTPHFRDELEGFRDDLRRRLAEITAERGLAREPTYPSLKAQAEAVGQTVEYSLAYRLDSQSAAHPSVLALQNLARQLPEGTIEVFAEPTPDNRLNVYSTGSVYLYEAVDMAGELIPQLRIEGLDEIGARLTDLAAMRIEEHAQREQA